MILADCVEPMLSTMVAGEEGEAAWWARRESVIVVLGTGVMLPLSFPESLDTLAGKHP